MAFGKRKNLNLDRHSRIHKRKKTYYKNMDNLKSQYQNRNENMDSSSESERIKSVKRISQNADSDMDNSETDSQTQVNHDSQPGPSNVSPQTEPGASSSQSINVAAGGGAGGGGGGDDGDDSDSDNNGNQGNTGNSGNNNQNGGIVPLPNRIIPVYRSLDRYNGMIRFEAALYYDAALAIVTDVGDLVKQCQHCDALKFEMERPGLCCNGGKVKLSPVAEPPSLIRSLLTGHHQQSRHFIKSSRQYNGLFNFTSFGANERIITLNGRRQWSPGFCVQGQVYHSMGSLFPNNPESPSFMQIYFLSQDQQLERRSSIFDGLNSSLINDLTNALFAINPYIHQFRSAVSTIRSSSISNLTVVIKENRVPRGQHRGTYNAPSSNNCEVAVLMPDQPAGPRDIVINKQDGSLQRINELHSSYDPLHYVLLLPNGDCGFSIHNAESLMKHYSHKLMVRSGTSTFMTQRAGEVTLNQTLNPLLAFGQLSNQYLVDMCSKLIAARLRWFRLHQREIRAESYSTLIDHLRAGQPASSTGRAVILPATFKGSPRYMWEKQQDSMAILRRFGKPTLFVTMTTNPKWDEISRNIYPHQNAQDRPDIVARVFAQKQALLIDMVSKKNIFGKCNGFVWNEEYQKRLLQHSHNLFWIDGHRPTPEVIDRMVSAEIPDNDTELQQLVIKHMVHGPCGRWNPSSPCMKDGNCTKGFPKPFQPITIVGDTGYPLYKRRSISQGGIEVEKEVTRNGLTTIVMIDNRWIVPHNKFLLKQFQCHLNVEICSSVQSVKYVLKYTNKGTDRAVFTLENDRHDEISEYHNNKYLGCNEAAAIMFGLKTGAIDPHIVSLKLHLPNEQQVIYDPTSATTESVSQSKKTMLEAFFGLCRLDQHARTLKFHEVPEYYIWDQRQSTWKRRRIGGPKTRLPDDSFVVRSNTIGRMFTISPKLSELYHLRILLVSVPGPVSFDDLLSVDGYTETSFKGACMRHGFLDDDQHLLSAMREVAVGYSAAKLRDLFITILCCADPTDVPSIWQQFADDMCEDILYAHRIANNDHTLPITDDMRGSVLKEIERGVLHAVGRPLSSFGLLVPATDLHNFFTNLSLHHHADTTLADRNVADQQRLSLNSSQLRIFNKVTDKLLRNEEGILYINASAGAGKSYLLNTLVYHIRGNGDVIVATAASACAALILNDARTVHTQFKVPLNINSDSMCNVSRGSELAQKLSSASLIVIDECTLLHRYVYEAIDRTMRDILDVDAPFGGKLIALTGDAKQCLPVIPGGGRAEISSATLKNSYLWSLVEKTSLVGSMRSSNLEWVEYLEFLGSGHLNDVSGNAELRGINIVRDRSGLINFIFPDLSQEYTDRAILAPLNKTADEINNIILNEAPGETFTYFSIDASISQEGCIRYPVEFLNSIESGSLPPHNLTLKTGTPIIVLRNLRPPKMVNGTRCIVKRLSNNVIEATSILGGETLFIPRVTLSPSDNTHEIIFKRKQFPVKVAYALTINKAQGQTLSFTGIDLNHPCFGHGQLYVALSRCRRPENICVYIPGEATSTPNPVYEECLI